METATFLTTFIISTVSLSGIVIYLGRRIIDKTLDIGVEKYKGSLNKELETHKTELLKEAEKFRANLQMLSLEHQVRYTKLHDARAQSIKELYSLLVDLQRKLEHFTSRLQGPEWATDKVRENAVQESLEKLFGYFETNRIYYPQSVCSIVDDILKLTREIIVDMGVAKITAIPPQFDLGQALALKEWREINTRVSTEFSSVREKLQAEFKNILGVE